jgi:preprotein translocase subunit SecA
MLEREEIYLEIDKLEEKIDKKIEDKLTALIPQAFAIIKETARRFFENKTLEVSASEFDKELAPHRDDISIKGDKAVYSNEWGSRRKYDHLGYDPL